jgi:ribosome biogenesis GTPase A
MKHLVNFTELSKKTSKKRIRTLDNLDKEKESYLELAEKIIDQSDILLEIIDARFIKETRIKIIEKKIKEKNKILIYVINKIDLINEKTKLLRETSFLLPRVFVSCKDHKG